jgi:hypothetical protein
MGRANKRRESQRVQELAYHEAGHAVAQIEFKHSFKHVTIVRTEPPLGHVEPGRKPKSINLDSYLPPRAARWIEDEILICLAGPAAEFRIKGRYNWRGARGDMDRVFELTNYLHGDNEIIGLYLKYMIARAKGQVVSQFWWPQIDALAKALVERQQLTSKQARKVCKQALIAHRGERGLPSKNSVRDKRTVR